MILDLAKVTAEKERIRGDEVVPFRDHFGNENRVDCRVEVDIRKVVETFYIDATVTGVFSTACHKCLESTCYQVQSSFKLVVQRARDRERHGALETAEDYLRLPAGQNDLSLDQYIYESLVVSVPIQIVCQDGCKGLCAGCGANLNREPCTCEAQQGDPRWDALRRPETTSNEY